MRLSIISLKIKCKLLIMARRKAYTVYYLPTSPASSPAILLLTHHVPATSKLSDSLTGSTSFYLIACVLAVPSALNILPFAHDWQLLNLQFFNVHSSECPPQTILSEVRGPATHSQGLFSLAALSNKNISKATKKSQIYNFKFSNSHNKSFQEGEINFSNIFSLS